MVDATINGNVGVNVNPSGMTKAASTVEKKIRDIVKAIEDAGKVADEKLKSLAIGMKQLDTLRSAGARVTAGDFGSAQNLGRQARALAEYRAGISKTSDALGVLRGRLVAVDVENGKLLQARKVPTKNSLLNAQNLEQTAAAYGKLTNQASALRGRIALLGDDSRKAFAPMLAQLDQLDAKNSKLFAQKNRFNFGPQLGQMQRMVGNLGQQVSLAEKAQKAERLKLNVLKEEGRQILTNTQLQREAELASAARAAQTRLRNLQTLSPLTGGAGPYQRQTDQMERLRRSMNLTAQVKQKLDMEMAKPSPNAARLNTLIERYRTLQREIGMAIAQQNKFGAAQSDPRRGGFMAGLRGSAGRLLGSEAEGGGTYGAGALVGRVGAYAVAAGAIYGLISSIQQGVRFAVEFEDALAQLKAVSGSTATEMDRLSEGIFNVSRNSVNSVMELTKSATIIAQAGFAGKDIEQMLQSVVNLSAASGSTADESVDILTSALGAFQLSASESARITDVLVAALNESKLGVAQMQLGLQFLGNTAAANNITFEELAATMATLADAGIKSGSTAATGTRQLLVDLMDPSEKLIAQLERIGLTTADIDVKVLGLSEVLTRLRDAGFEAYGTLETRASAAFVALSRNIDHTQDLLEATQQAGVAQKAAEERADSLAAKWQQLLNGAAEIGAELGKNFIPLMKILVEVLNAVVQSFGAIVVVLTSPLRLLGLLTEKTDYLGVSLEEARASFEAAGYSAEEAAARAQMMGEGLDDVTSALRDTEAKMADVETQQTSLRSETEKLIMRQEEMAGANGNLNETTTAVSAAVQNLAARFPGLRDEFAKTQGGIAGLIQAMAALDRKAQETLRNLAQTALAEADMERQAALKELGGVSRSTFRANTQPYRGTPREQLENPGYVRDRARFQQLMQQNTTNSLQQAHRLLQQNPRLQRAYSTTYRELTGALSRYNTARQNTDTNRERLGAAEFALSDQGQELLGYMRQDTAMSARAQSQGSAGGQSRAQLQQTLRARNARYDELEAQLKDNPYAASLLDAARVSTNAAYNRLTPEPDKTADAAAKKARTAAERAAAKGQREAERRERELERIDGKIAKEELEFRKEQYDNAIDAFKNTPDIGENLEDLLDTVDEKMTAWLGAEAETAVQEIEALNPTQEQRAKMLATAGRKAEELRDGEINKLADTLASVIKEFIDRTTNAIERQYNEAMRFTERDLALAQARLEGMNSPLLEGSIPEYLKVIQQRKVDVASERNTQASQAAGQRRLEQYRDMLAKVQADKEEVEARLQTLGTVSPVSEEGEILVIAQLGESRRELRGLNDDLLKINDSIYDQQLALEGLRARYSVLNEVPRTFGEGMRMAAEAMRIQIGNVDSFGQELINNLDQPLAALHEGFKGFFSDMLSGSVGVGQAFKNLATTVIKAIEQMVAVALAKQFFSLILGAIFPGASTNLLEGTPYGYRGGQIGSLPKHTQGIPKMYTGGMVAGGLPTRDSTLIHAAKEEYLIRRPAAQSLGKGFLDAINARGAHALKGMGATNIVAPANNNTPPVNVYVVAPEEKPTMGPNDVLATFSNDVLKGGVTKKLIKQVAAGG